MNSFIKMKVIILKRVQDDPFYKHIMNKVQKELKSHQDKLFYDDPVGPDHLKDVLNHSSRFSILSYHSV